MRKIFCLLIILASFSSNAAYIGNQTPSMMFGAGTIKFGVNGPPSDTCDYFSRQFKFDATTESGKNILSIQLAAMMSKKEIDIWYTPSTTPGTTKDNGCIVGTLATINEIGIK